MKNLVIVLSLFALLVTSCNSTKKTTEPVLADPPLREVVSLETEPIGWKAEDHYIKQEVYITMRDGVKLFTQVYTPKEASSSNTYPVIMQRTCYSVRPYGTEFKSTIGPNEFMMKEGYIVVYQDVRGRWMSEGEFDNMRPIVPIRNSNTDIDESTDTYDTVDWLIKNVDHNNGRVGQWGISYPGFYATNATIAAHPAMKAVSPQAPIGDFYFDDFHHNGAYTLSYWSVNNLFGIHKTEPVDTAWYSFPTEISQGDMYDFYLKNTPLSKIDKITPKENFFWQQIKDHPNYDYFWQKRGIIQHLKKDVTPAVMTVGGWYDAEDLYGPLMTYKTIEDHNPNTYNTIVMGPWSHGDWARKNGRQAVGNVFFGEGINESFQENVESKFFRHFLKEGGKGSTGLPDAYMFDSGKKIWNEFAQWPPKAAEVINWSLMPDGSLGSYKKEYANKSAEFVSDPKKPVPFRMDIKPMFIPRKYMADDQRTFSRRPDVLVWESDVLEVDITLAGPITADLFVSTTGSDADWVVKLIDVYPQDAQDTEETQDHIVMGGYQQLVRGEVMRGRFRDSFEHPAPFIPNNVTNVKWQLQDVHHTFKKGHKIMFHVQSSWFPYVDVNPQTYVSNIFEAKESDFQKQTHKLHHSKEYNSKIHVTYIPRKQ